MRLTWLSFRREFASDRLSFQNESTGVVHIELRDSVADAQIVLPEELQSWIKAAGTQLALSGAEGVALSEGGDAIRLLASAERTWPANLRLQSGQGALNIRIVKAN